MMCINMLSPFTLTWIFSNVNCTCIVTKYGNASRVNRKVLELLPYPQQLSTIRSSRCLLGFYCGHGNRLLFCGCPRDQIGLRKRSHTWGAFSINQESSIISICISNEIKIAPSRIRLNHLKVSYQIHNATLISKGVVKMIFRSRQTWPRIQARRIYLHL